VFLGTKKGKTLTIDQEARIKAIQKKRKRKKKKKKKKKKSHFALFSVFSISFKTELCLLMFVFKEGMYLTMTLGEQHFVVTIRPYLS